MSISSFFPLLIIGGCSFISLSNDQSTIETPTSSASDQGLDQSSWFDVYFTEPDSPETSTLRGGTDANLAEAIQQAKLSVEVAMDNLDLWSLRDALLDAHRRGVAVRVIIESDNLFTEEVQELIESGVPLQDDRNPGLMHNKFVIIDRLEVWTGSMNFTVNGAYRSDNNLIRIRSPELAQDYLVEFDEMFADRQFGANSPANTPWPVLLIEGTQVEVYFSPDDGTIERLIGLVESAQDEVLAYSFTDDELASALKDAVNSGVIVAGVLDKSQALGNIGGEYEHLLENGIEVRLDGNPYSMHHKVLIIDDQILVTGSYNFSNSAKTRNDENTLVIHSPEMAELFNKEFERVWLEAQH
jgi:phosphatidylserine/phosphatidylglycerophosphate/cardiolipin synthase-like enzyme